MLSLLSPVANGYAAVVWLHGADPTDRVDPAVRVLERLHGALAEVGALLHANFLPRLPSLYGDSASVFEYTVATLDYAAWSMDEFLKTQPLDLGRRDRFVETQPLARWGALAVRPSPSPAVLLMAGHDAAAEQAGAPAVAAA